MKSAFIPRPVLWLLLGVSSAASMGYYVAAIWSANQPPGFSDLYAPWWAAHESLLHHRNPYSPVIAHEIQTVIYGAPVAPSSDDPSGLGGGFAYPPFATLLLWPTVYSSFANAQKIFLLAILPLTMLSLWLWLRCLRLRLSTLHCVILTLFMFGSFPVLQAFRLQNLSLLAAAFIAITVFLVAGNRLIPAGIFLAASTFKPQFTVALNSLAGALGSCRLAPSPLPGLEFPVHDLLARRDQRMARARMDRRLSTRRQLLPPLHLRPFPARCLVLSHVRPRRLSGTPDGYISPVLAASSPTRRFAQVPSRHQPAAGCECPRDPDPRAARPAIAAPWILVPAARRQRAVAVNIVRAHPAGRRLGTADLALDCRLRHSPGRILAPFPLLVPVLAGPALHQSAAASGAFARPEFPGACSLQAPLMSILPTPHLEPRTTPANPQT